MPKIFPVVIKRDGGAALPPGDMDFTWDEDATVADQPKFTTRVGPDENQVADEFRKLVTSLDDDISAADSFRTANATTLAEPVNVEDVVGSDVRIGEDVQVADELRRIVPNLDDDASVDDPLRTTTTAEFAEDASVADHVKAITRLSDDASADDLLNRLNVKALNEAVSVDDLLNRLNAKALAENANANDFGKARITDVTYGRTGTPDTDPGGDAWTDKASQATNHGNEALSIQGEALNTERRGLLEFNFTLFTGMTVLAGGTHRFRLRASHSAAAGDNTLRVRFSTLAARPFTESTVTWDTPVADGGGPAEGTLVLSAAVTVAAGAAAEYTITLTDANITSFLGNWVYVRLLSEATLATTVFTVSSREDATEANRPAFSFALKR